MNSYIKTKIFFSHKEGALLYVVNDIESLRDLLLNPSKEDPKISLFGIKDVFILEDRKLRVVDMESQFSNDSNDSPYIGHNFEVIYTVEDVK